MKNARRFKAKGIDTVAWSAVNDVFVMEAWGRRPAATARSNSRRRQRRVRQGDRHGLTARGLGVRSKRYAMVVDDGVVKALNVEEGPGKSELTSADALLKQM